MIPKIERCFDLSDIRTLLEEAQRYVLQGETALALQVFSVVEQKVAALSASLIAEPVD